MLMNRFGQCCNQFIFPIFYSQQTIIVNHSIPTNYNIISLMVNFLIKIITKQSHLFYFFILKKNYTESHIIICRSIKIEQFKLSLVHSIETPQSSKQSSQPQLLLILTNKNNSKQIILQIISLIYINLKQLMSQPSSSIISADNAQIKYKKALKQISKLISANRTLRESSEKSTRDLKQKIQELSLRYQDLIKQYESIRKEKDSSDRYLDQIQKQKNNLERQLGYLNDVVQQQTTQIKKLSMHKDERAVAALIRTYEEKQATMNRSRNINQQMIGKLKSTVERQENQLQYERTSKEQYEDRYKALSLQMNRYKQQNSALLEQIERLIKEGSQKDTYCVQKQKELRSLLSQFQKQVSMLKTAQEQSYKQAKSAPDENYQTLLNEKNRLSIELTKMQTAYQQLMVREKQFYEMEEKMKSAKLQADRANEQVNMLKSKIIVLEAKQFLEEAGDDDYGQKQFEERLNLLVSQNDPLNSIKNQQDNSHFKILKAFIVDLQDKVYKISAQKKEIAKKYKSVKNKFVKNAQQLILYQQQNKVMKGKLQGYQRLTEKLQFELQRSLSSHQQQITRMTITSNNIMTKKIEQYKSTINLLNTQLQINLDKADRTQKNYKQQTQTLKLQLDTLKIKYKDESQKSNKDNQLIQLYKKKNNQLTARINSFEEQLVSTNQNLSRFQHLFKEEKGKNQGLLAQKQQLLAQTRQLSEEIDKKSSNFNNDYKIKQEQYEFEIRKLKSDNQKFKDELQFNSRSVSNIQKQLQNKRKGDLQQVQQIKRQSQRNAQLEGKVLQLKKKIRELEDENETIKIKSKKFQQTYDKTNKYEQENITKSDKINDLSRQKIMLESQIKNIQNLLADQRKQNEQFKKDISNIKMKSLQQNHESRRQFQSKLFQSKKTIQSLTQDNSDLTTELRDEKSKNSRLTNQLTTIKSQKNRLQEIIQQNRKKQWQNQNQVGSMKLDLSNAEMQVQRFRSQLKNQQSISNNLNQQIQNFQQKIFTLNQQISNLKMKVQSSQDMKIDLVKDLNSMKFNFGSVENYSNQARNNINLGWAEQNFHNSLGDILTKTKRIFRNYGVTIQSSSYNYQSIQTSYMPATAVPQPISQSVSPTPRSKVTIQGEKDKQDNTYLEYIKPFTEISSNRNVMTSYTNPSISNPKQNVEQNKVGTSQSLGLNKGDFMYSVGNYDVSYKTTNYSTFNNEGTTTTKPAFDYLKGISDYNYNTEYKNDAKFNFAELGKTEEQ